MMPYIQNAFAVGALARHPTDGEDCSQTPYIVAGGEKESYPVHERYSCNRPFGVKRPYKPTPKYSAYVLTI